MSSFRQYGGLNRAATNNIVRNHYSNSDNPTISNFLGLYNSKIVSESHLDLSGNSILNINGIYFDNGTTIIDGSFNGDLTVNGNLEVKKFTMLDGSLEVKGENAVFLGNMDVQKNVVFSSTLEVGDRAIFYQGIDTLNLNVDEDATITRLEVGGITTLNGPTFAYSNVFLNNELEVVGNSTFDACLNVLGDTTIYNTLNIGKTDVSVNATPGTYYTSVQGNYMIYTFINSSAITFTFSGNYDVSYILVGGGGGGGGGGFAGAPGGGGGGGGQVVVGSTAITSGNTYSITVGSGGAGGTGQKSVGGTSLTGGNGSSSSFKGVTAYGGSGGYASSTGSPNTSHGGNSGSGGTGGAGNTNPGGTGANGGGGGGGQYLYNGGNGAPSSTTISFNGYGTSFGAGGSGAGGDAGSGSGGNSYAGSGNSKPSNNAVDNYGGGGGGGGGGNGVAPGYDGGNGGSGVVIIYFDTSIPTKFDTVISGGDITTGGTVTAGTFVSGSDYRIKTDVKPLDTSFAIDQLNPVTYTNKLLGKQDTGFIAHEVQEIFPHLVTGIKDGEETQTLNYQGLIAILTREIQELKKRVQELENK